MIHKHLFNRTFFHVTTERGVVRPTVLIALFPILLFTTLLLSPRILTYSYFGSIVIRRSELGPLTGLEASTIKLYGPGHDFGAISSESVFDINPQVIQPFSYLFDGRMVIRHSELGPLTGETYSAAQLRGPGRDYGAISSESVFDISRPAANPFSYTIAGRTMMRSSELGPLTGETNK